MQIIDSNIIIYASRPEYDFLRVLIEKNIPFVSIISKIEVLGYHQLKKQEKELLEVFFRNSPIIGLTDEIVNLSIELRQKQNLSLADSIIASTALLNELELVTRNTADFARIPKLKLLNPFKGNH